MSDLDRAAVLAALDAVYQQVTTAVSGLSERDLMRPSRCAGWAVADVLYHELLDARRALRTFATPSDGPADRDDVTYWRDYAPGTGEDSAPDGEAAAAHARYVRIAASAYPPPWLLWDWSETAAAACRAARACDHRYVGTQGHVLSLADFMATLAVEAAVHYLDLTVDLPSAPDPDPAALALVRRVLTGLLGAPLPGFWDGTTAALKGTGREPLTGKDRDALGPLTSAFPLFAWLAAHRKAATRPGTPHRCRRSVRRRVLMRLRTAADRGGDDMRMIVMVELDTTTTNRAIRDGSFAQAVERLLDRLRPETSYFYARGGRRAFLLVVDVPDAASLPGFAEPLWQELNAHVEVLPCMNLEELREGLSRVG